MKIELKKFGTTLVSRQTGREALSAFAPTIKTVGSQEKIEVDFAGVITFSPSWGDEFLTPLLRDYGDKVILVHTGNPSVRATITILEKIIGNKFVTDNSIF